jgi:polyisoprenyl-phosphate glycosyltransferase
MPTGVHPFMTAQSILLTAVVPCYNEEESIQEFHTRLTNVLRGMGEPYEIVYVNDGSKDKTAERLRALYNDDPQVVVLMFSRNFGHQQAVSAGLTASRGQGVVILDADLQDPPELIPEMVATWRRGYQVVYGVREKRDGENSFKVWTAKAFYRIMNLLSDVKMPLDTGVFRLVDRQVVETLLAMPERHRLLRGMCSWAGFSQIGIPYHRARRFAGHTKYPLEKMVKLALEGIVSFSIVPLRLMTILGFFSAALAVVGIVWSLIVRLYTHAWVQGWTTLLLAILFVGSVQMICLGILGEYVGRIYTEVKQRPLFVLRESLRRQDQSQTAATREDIPM